MGWRGHDMPYPVFIFLNHETNEFYVSKTEKECSPPKEFYGIEQSWRFPAWTKVDKIELLLQKELTTFEDILNKTVIEWNSNNNVAIQNDKASKLTNKIKKAIMTELLDFNGNDEYDYYTIL